MKFHAEPQRNSKSRKILFTENHSHSPSGLKSLASDAVPQLAQCGLVEYKPLADGSKAWAEYMSQLLQNDCLNVDQEKLKYFDIKNTIRMIDEVYRQKLSSEKSK